MLWTAFVNVDKLGIISIEENSFSKKGKSHLYRPVAAEIHKILYMQRTFNLERLCFVFKNRDNETSYPVYERKLKGPQTNEIYEVSSKAEPPY